MKAPMTFSTYQRGVMLLEALIAILIFSMGILAIVGLQVSSIKLANDAKYRSDASLLSNRYIGAMWAAHSSPTFVADFSSPNGAQFLLWKNSGVAATLPTTGASAPTVTIAQSAVATASTVSSSVTIDIYWSVPGESTSGAGTHRYNTQTQIAN